MISFQTQHSSSSSHTCIKPYVHIHLRINTIILLDHTLLVSSVYQSILSCTSYDYNHTYHDRHTTFTTRTTIIMPPITPTPTAPGQKESEPYWADAIQNNVYFAYWIGKRQELRSMDRALSRVKARQEEQNFRINAIEEELNGRRGPRVPGRLVLLMNDKERLLHEREKKRIRIRELKANLRQARQEAGWRVENIWHERQTAQSATRPSSAMDDWAMDSHDSPERNVAGTRPYATPRPHTAMAGRVPTTFTARRPDSAIVFRTGPGPALPNSSSRPHTAMAGQAMAGQVTAGQAVRFPFSAGGGGSPPRPNSARPRTPTGRLMDRYPLYAEELDRNPALRTIYMRYALWEATSGL